MMKQMRVAIISCERKKIREHKLQYLRVSPDKNEIAFCNGRIREVEGLSSTFLAKYKLQPCSTIKTPTNIVRTVKNTSKRDGLSELCGSSLIIID